MAFGKGMEDPMRKATMMRAVAPALALLATPLVGACGFFSQSTPDEFQVVARAPLEVPPDFNLRPPQPGSPRPQELARERSAAGTVFGATSSRGLINPRGSALQSEGEVALLTQAGADRADPDIRAIVDRENPGVVVGDRSLLDRLLFWRDSDRTPEGALVVIERDSSQIVP